MTGGDLSRAATEALALVAREPGVVEAEIFASANRALLCRLNYTSHLPCNGVEEPKSTEAYGLGMQIVLDGADGPRIGFGSEPSDLSAAGARRAFEKARLAAVRDPEFRCLPRPGRERRSLPDYHDPALLDVGDEQMVEAGWRLIGGALSAFMASSRLAALAGSETRLANLGLVLGGDVTILAEQVAIASTQMPKVQTDLSTLMSACVTAMVETQSAKGSGWSICSRLDHFTEEAGVDAARNAIGAMDGERVSSGDYTVIFGHQPFADLLNNLVIPGCEAGAFYTSSSPFLGKLGRSVASPLLSIYDDGAMPGLTGSKGITCEGMPTGRTELIREGRLVGLLANWYESQRLLHDPAIREKLGIGADSAGPALVPRNGFRFGAGGGRAFDMPPGVAASNVIVQGADPVTREELVRRVGNGLYVGRIWYTYPINGLRAGDFTCTVVGDSFVIRDGRITTPLKANTLRINDNIGRLLQHVVGATRDARGTLVWAADEVAYVPEIAVTGVHVDAIAGFMEGSG